MRFRPCIDLHDGKVKQIVGGTLSDSSRNSLETNFVACQSPSYFADLYYRDGFTGGHVIMLGPNNEDAAREALAAHPGNLQVGGGITPENAAMWLDCGAEKVIVTSFIFENAHLSLDRLERLAHAIPPEKLVLDLSCRKCGDGLYRVACNRWQTVCDTVIDSTTFGMLAKMCSEYLVHAVDVEGRQAGIDEQLLNLLARDCPLPVTYAGGVRNWEDIEHIRTAGNGRIDFTVGSALDIFGGGGIAYEQLKYMEN